MQSNNKVGILTIQRPIHTTKLEMKRLLTNLPNVKLVIDESQWKFALYTFSLLI